MFDHDLDSGKITDGPIRYLMLRADVLMGVARELGDEHATTFVDALERAAFRQSRESFEQYAVQGRFGTDDFLVSSSQVAARLGWGTWSVRELDAQTRQVEVRDSPFAAGAGRSSYPVCGAIRGVLRAIALVGYGQEVEVREVSCAAQGKDPVCRFHIGLSP